MTLQARNLTLARGGAPILADVSLTLAPGALVGLLGANGAGKSTLLAALAGELAPRSGQVLLGDTDLAAFNARQLARRRAVLPQKPSLSFDLGVSDVVGMGAYPFPELDPAAVRQLVRDALERAGVTHLAQRRYPQLSGGEQQRVQFARVLAQCHAMRAPGQTRYLMLDEPISNLDPRHQMELLATARALAHEAGMGVLVIVHDINQAARWCDTLALLADGRLAALGPPDEVLTPDNMRRVYGIETDVLAHPTLPGRLLVLAR